MSGIFFVIQSCLESGFGRVLRAEEFFYDIGYHLILCFARQGF